MEARWMGLSTRVPAGTSPSPRLEGEGEASRGWRLRARMRPTAAERGSCPAGTGRSEAVGRRRKGLPSSGEAAAAAAAAPTRRKVRRRE
ncbi:Os07g0479350 [Oryza sativa Japonica Group]|uniref:Os07g0479350 protein n=1 Tax=Oryza sativa subsp. japonica TaxID=39947 RepID=A0A0P0X6P3_ORYSJ|nr:hypothetical protein EE612_039213 [Oryza sativa]BAT01472.1 Os07g0479350 [Oryza sativa Japonica Group]